jgi:hypothetical protein
LGADIKNDGIEIGELAVMTNDGMIEIEFVREFCCYQLGQRKRVQPGFAQIMIEAGNAKVVSEVRNKMISEPAESK